MFHQAHPHLDDIQLVQMRQIVDTACEVGSALQYLHSKRLVHGDLKADNVLLQVPRTGKEGIDGLSSGSAGGEEAMGWLGEGGKYPVGVLGQEGRVGGGSN